MIADEEKHNDGPVQLTIFDEKPEEVTEADWAELKRKVEYATGLTDPRPDEPIAEKLTEESALAALMAGGMTQEQAKIRLDSFRQAHDAMQKFFGQEIPGVYPPATERPAGVQKPKETAKERRKRKITKDSRRKNRKH